MYMLLGGHPYKWTSRVYAFIIDTQRHESLTMNKQMKTKRRTNRQTDGQTDTRTQTNKTTETAETQQQTNVQANATKQTRQNNAKIPSQPANPLSRRINKTN